MDHLRRLQAERPLLFWVATAIAIWLAFQVALILIALVVGPLGLPSWAPIVVLLVVLALIARRQAR